MVAEQAQQRVEQAQADVHRVSDRLALALGGGADDGTVRTRRRELADGSAAHTAAKAELAAAVRALDQLQTQARDPKRQQQVEQLVALTHAASHEAFAARCEQDFGAPA